jgi:hypothetical protein
MPAKARKLSYEWAVLIATAVLVAVFVVIPSAFYDLNARDLGRVNLAFVGFGVLVVAQFFVDITTRRVRLRALTWLTVRRILIVFIAVFSVTISINAKIRFRLSTIEDAKFEACLSPLPRWDKPFFKMSERREECYGRWYRKVLHGGDCQCVVPTH